MAAVDPGGHAHRRRRGLQAVIEWTTEDIHVQQLGHEAAVLEESLPLPVVRVGLADVRRQEFAAPVDLVAHGRDEMLRAAGPEEVQILRTVLVSSEEIFQVPSQRVFVVDRFRQIQLALEAQSFRDLDVEIHDILGADLFEHLRLHLGHRVGYVGVDPF